MSDGWKLVPVEPTEAMLAAPSGGYPSERASIWSAMLAASPSAPVDEKGKVQTDAGKSKADDDGAEIPAGMKRWTGGDSAPGDWRWPLAVMLRRGDVVHGMIECDWYWRHDNRGWDIIAYTPKTDAKSGGAL